MEIIGTLKVKFDTQRVSEKFSKREFVLTTSEDTPYPQHVSMQVTQDKCPSLDLYNVGDKMKVQFNLNGREWNGSQGIKYFNTVDVWKLDLVERGSAGSQNSVPIGTQSNANSTSASVFTGNTSDSDDLPY